MNDFIALGWEGLLRRNGLGRFEDVWNVDRPLYEPANRRRGGWSNVIRMELQTDSVETIAIFIKRQENHTRRTWLHPIKGQSTYESELRNIARLAEFGVPSVTPIYFATRRVDGNLRAVMITEALNGFRSLDDWIRQWEREGWPSRQSRRHLFLALAGVLRNLHAHCVQHGSLYPKHIFVRHANGPATEGAEPAVRLIDLESTRRRMTRRRAILRDFDTLNRHSPQWSRSDRLRFFLRYLEIERLTPRARRLLRRVAALADAKRRKAGASNLGSATHK